MFSTGSTLLESSKVHSQKIEAIWALPHSAGLYLLQVIISLSDVIGGRELPTRTRTKIYF